MEQAGKIKNEDLNVERDLSKPQNVFICDFIGDDSSERRFAYDVIANHDIIPTYIDIDSSTITTEDVIKVHFDNEWICLWASEGK